MSLHTAIPADELVSAGARTARPAPGPALAGPARPRATWNRRARDSAKRALRVAFELGQRLGVDVLPRHFYSEIPCIRDLRRDDSWKTPHTMHGVRGADPQSQFAFVESCCTAAIVDRLARGDVFGRACAANGEPGFGPIDGDFLCAFIQAVRPPRIVQVGCGVSTSIMLLAASEAGYRPEVVCVEPYPTAYLREAARAGEIRLIAEKAQAVALETLTGLGPGGFLFVDSTHTVKPGSEVNRLILEVLPRLGPGSWVHFHDIYFPYNYQRGLLDDELFFCNESALLHAFLINNPAFAVRASLSMLHDADPSRLGRSLPNYRPAHSRSGLRLSAEGDFPGSTYLQVVDR
jgi:predicted O-methyltransferase YrrM